MTTTVANVLSMTQRAPKAAPGAAEVIPPPALRERGHRGIRGPDFRLYPEFKCGEMHGHLIAVGSAFRNARRICVPQAGRRRFQGLLHDGTTNVRHVCEPACTAVR